MIDEPTAGLAPCRPRPIHRARYWLLVAGGTLLFSLEPGLSLVLLAIGLSGLAATWIGMLVVLLAKDALHDWHARRR